MNTGPERDYFLQDSVSVKNYYNDIRKIEVLSGDDQIELAKKAKKGDKQAFDTLITTNLRFVVSVAKEYRYSGLPLEDLISEGNIGLMEAVNRFDEKKGFKFISYAVWWVRHSLIKAVQDHAKNVRLPLNRINSTNKIIKAKEVLYQKLNREPTDQELLEILEGVTESDVRNFNMTGNLEMSINEGINDTSDIEVKDFLASDSYERFEEESNHAALKNELAEVMKELEERELKIISMYFGLNEEEPVNLKDIAKRVGLTNERVRQIKEDTLKRLRSFEKSSSLREFLDTQIGQGE